MSCARVEDAAVRGGGSRPLQYEKQRAAFRYLELFVDGRVLIPRPETEVVVDVALRVSGGGGGVAIDIGTGSGAIALSLVTEGSFDRVIATDISNDALAVARLNAEALPREARGRLELRQGSLVSAVRGVRARLVVSNPPYIATPEAAALPASVRSWEPPVALLSGEDGMAATTAIIRDAHQVLEPGGWLVLETDSRRAGAVESLLRDQAHFERITIHPDLTGRDRVLSARLAN